MVFNRRRKKKNRKLLGLQSASFLNKIDSKSQNAKHSSYNYTELLRRLDSARQRCTRQRCWRWYWKATEKAFQSVSVWAGSQTELWVNVGNPSPQRTETRIAPETQPEWFLNQMKESKNDTDSPLNIFDQITCSYPEYKARTPSSRPILSKAWNMPL